MLLAQKGGNLVVAHGNLAPMTGVARDEKEVPVLLWWVQGG